MASGATVGSAVIKLSFDGKSVKAELDGISKEIDTSGTKAGKRFGDAWSVAAGSLISKGVSKIASAITSSFDTAIARVDTLNNSQKVFTAMGYSAEATAESMSTLTEYLDGLPTSMTTAVSSVQSLAASFGGIERGTEIFVDINNAGLAFGATTAQIENAIMQLGQTSLDGPLDAATWNSLRNSGFSPVFAAMAKEAGITVGELKEQFGAKGDKTINDFLQQLHKLGTEGGGDMASLAELAKQNTNGIGTAFENVQNRIGKAIAKIIDHIGSERIAKAINDISSGFSGVADVVINIIDFLGQNQWVLDMITAFFVGLLGMGIAQKIASFFSMLAAFASTNPVVLAIGAISAVLFLLITHIEDVGKWFQDVFGGVGEFMQNVGQGIADFFSGVWNGVIEGVQNVWSFFTGVFSGIGEFLGNVWNTITSTLGQFIAKFGEFIGGIFKGAINGVLAFIEGFVNLPIDALNGFIGIINSAFGWIGVDIGYIDRIQLPRLAQGGYADGATTAIIGEEGKEAVLPLENNTDNWAGLLASTLVDEMEAEGMQSTTGGVTVYMTNEINNEMDAQDIGRVLMQSIRRAA